MARIVPYAAIQFSAHEQWKHVLGIVDEVHGQKQKSDLFQYKRFVAGSLAGMTAQSLTYPLDLTRARLAVSPRSKYANLVDVFAKIIKEEGFWTLYRGYVATMVGVIPYAGTSFFVYESLKNWHARRSETPINPLERLIFGATAGGIAQTSSYPLDIVRRRLQVGQFSRNYSYSIIGILRDVYREEGIFHGWYKGITINFIKGPIAVGLSFVTFDLTQSFLRSVA
jgi:solute carrier family 25 protein 42